MTAIALAMLGSVLLASAVLALVGLMHELTHSPRGRRWIRRRRYAMQRRNDALVGFAGCDKTLPGMMMAMARVNRPSLMVYGGTIKPGFKNGDKLDIVSAFQCYGQFLAGTITEEERKEIVRKSCPGAGACGGMYTANTMASAIEALGMALPFSASFPA
jgi:dihydroxyacid dehydratase/phosphogluconate dehydratase